LQAQNLFDRSSNKKANLFLLGDTDSLASAAGGLGVLTADTDAPVVTKTTMGADLLQALQVLAHLVVQEVSHHLVGLAWKKKEIVKF
jgi:hypothetical protein